MITRGFQALTAYAAFCDREHKATSGKAPEGVASAGGSTKAVKISTRICQAASIRQFRVAQEGDPQDVLAELVEPPAAYEVAAASRGRDRLQFA